MIPSRRLVLYLFAAAPLFLAGSLYGVFLGIGVVYLLLLAAWCTLALVLMPSHKKLRIERSLPQKISQDYPTEVTLTIENNSRRTLRVSLAENFPQTMRIEPKRLSVRIKPRQVRTVTYRLTCAHRGPGVLDQLYVRFAVPFGMWVRSYAAPITTEFKVYPNLMSIQKYELLLRRGSVYESGLLKRRMLGQGREFESLRSYVAGDELSRVAWKASAKRQKLIVKNYEPEQQQSIILAIDLGRATSGEFSGLSRVDYLVNAALMLGYTVLRQKDWFSLIAFNSRIQAYLPPVSGIKNVNRIADCLYSLEPAVEESNYAKMFRFLMRTNRKRSLLCLMTDLTGVEANSDIISYMIQFGKQHLPLIVSLCDTEILTAAGRKFDKHIDPYTRAAAIDHLNVRSQALALLRQRGVSTLDITPDQLTPALINRYLAIKARYQL